MRHYERLWLSLLIAAGCSESLTLPSSSGSPGPVSCAEGQELHEGACVDPAKRYEPLDRVDQDNVAAYGELLTELTLPEPPKSGFRLIAPPRTLAPGEEWEGCISFRFPSIQNRTVYAGRLYTSGGLHHSNLISKPVDAAVGPNPYPECHPGASDPFSRLPEVVPDVLFANSTQVEGGETLVFPEGLGFEVDPTREITTNIHYLNPTNAPLRAEVVYDFFTMKKEDVKRVVVPFVMQVNEFLIPPHSVGKVGSSCATYGGDIVTMMPHAHKLLQGVTVDRISSAGVEERLLTQGAFDTASDIRMFNPAIKLEEGDELRYECTFNNTTDHDVIYGIGENEMCVLFGYMAPPRLQFLGFSEKQGDPCFSVQIGLFRKD